MALAGIGYSHQVNGGYGMLSHNSGPTWTSILCRAVSTAQASHIVQFPDENDWRLALRYLVPSCMHYICCSMFKDERNQ